MTRAHTPDTSEEVRAVSLPPYGRSCTTLSPSSFSMQTRPLGFAWSTKGFVLFSLMGYDASAAQKAKITRKSKAVRCKAVLPERKCVQAMKSTRPILAVSARALKLHGRISARQNRVCPCQLMVFSSEVQACWEKSSYTTPRCSPCHRS